MNPFEGVRDGLAAVAVLVNVIGYTFCTNGIVAFDFAIRKIMLLRRRVQMLVYISWSCSLFTMAFISSFMEDTRPLTWQAITINMLYIYLISSLIGLSLFQSAGWMSFQYILGNDSLVPNNDEKLRAAVLDGREMGHTIANNMQIFAGAMELAIASGTLDSATRIAITNAMQKLSDVAGEVTEIHSHIRSSYEVTK